MDKLEDATASLSSTIHDDKNYSVFKQRQAEDLAIENARRLTDAVQLLKQQQCFLLSYIGDNPTATASAAFIGVAKEIESRLSGTSDLGDIRPLTDKIDALIAQNGLHDRFAVSVAGPCKFAPDEREQKQKEDEARRQILAKDQLVAAQLIKDASDFLKYSRKINSPTTLTIAERIAALNGALKAASLEEIELATTTLSNTINGDKNYADFKRQQSEELAQENARKLADVNQLLSQQECFLLSYIADNPTASASASFLGYSEEIKAARLPSAPDLKEIGMLSERINASIIENGLNDQFVASIGTCNGSHDQLVKDQAAAQQLIDEASEFLKYLREINGDNTLVIAQAIASLNGVKNGADAADAGKLEAATFTLSETIHNEKSYTDFSQRQANRVAQENARRLADAIQLIKEQQCFLLSYIAEKPTAPGSTTFVAQSKEIETSLKSPNLNEIRPLIEQIDASIAQNSLHDQYEVSIAGPCKTVSPEAKALEAKIVGGAVEGYGFVILTSASSNRVCATPAVSRDGHQRVVELLSDHFSGILGRAPSLVFTSLDDVFVQVRQGTCGAVYAPAAELKNLLVELKHDAITYRVDENWIAQAQVDQSQQEFEDQKALDKQHEADRREKAEGQQKALREKYGRPAEAAVAAVTNDVKAYLETGGKDPELVELLPRFHKMVFKPAHGSLGVAIFELRAL